MKISVSLSKTRTRNGNHAPKNHTCQNSWQVGFSLVEILVAMVLSAVLVGGVIQMYLSSKESYRLQNEMARMQENQRLALAFLQRDIRKAGYFVDDDPTNPNANHIAKFDVSLDSNGKIMTSNGGDNPTDNDFIAIRYEATEDCLGQDLTSVASAVATDGNIYAINRYFVQTNTAGIPQLMCLGNGNVSPQPLVSGVENMQVLYGENTDGLTPGIAPTANRYVQPQEANLSQVVSVRISLLFTSEKNIRNKTIATQYNLLDAGSLTFNDKKRRQVVTTTIQLRNNT